MATVPTKIDLTGLSPRGQAILRQVAYPLILGFTISDIANDLGTSKQTVARLRDELRDELAAQGNGSHRRR